MLSLNREAIEIVMSDSAPPLPGVTVLPGVPNMAGLTVDDSVVPFPDSTSDFVKLIRERGISVNYSVPRDQRIYVGHKAFELWLPILEFTRDLLIGIEGGLLVELLKSYLHPADDRLPTDITEGNTGDATPDPKVSAPAILHVEWHVSRPDGERQTFIADGSESSVLDALARFEDHVRNVEGP